MSARRERIAARTARSTPSTARSARAWSPFGGWEMPIQYTGVLEEHRACREHAVVFDVSHLGSVRVRGAGAFATLQWALTNDLDRIAPGRAQYTHLLDPDDAHVVDDIIVWWVAPGEFLVMPNASNTAPLVDALGEAARVPRWRASARSTTSPPTARCSRCRARGAGAARARCSPRPPRSPRFEVRAGRRSTARRAWVAGTGYTGEDGVEIHVPAAQAAGVWQRAARRRHHARRARRARHAAARGRAAAARPRARPGHHAAAGRARLGGALRQGRLPGPGAARGRARPRRRPPAARPRRPRAARSRARATR